MLNGERPVLREIAACDLDPVQTKVLPREHYELAIVERDAERLVGGIGLRTAGLQAGRCSGDCERGGTHGF